MTITRAGRHSTPSAKRATTPKPTTHNKDDRRNGVGVAQTIARMLSGASSNGDNAEVPSLKRTISVGNRDGDHKGGVTPPCIGEKWQNGNGSIYIVSGVSADGLTYVFSQDVEINDGDIAIELNHNIADFTAMLSKGKGRAHEGWHRLKRHDGDSRGGGAAERLIRIKSPGVEGASKRQAEADSTDDENETGTGQSTTGGHTPKRHNHQ